ncbi:hypothetical protein [Magnetospirillum molischianum]|uniref:Uncharacterized protein n=1 Tax=Magnetospirillum molischianum DSM 120 TaxID=1150626 RepID=H8FVL1_MAGML|nr:hypothetical protein [Magnetospirillum molischianum]CCG42399.1 hypothetical protein PHAMO_380067 [Magnetospirillum molischianum DSM 120]
MESGDIIGLLVGVGALAAMVGVLTNVYLHPDRFEWLEILPEDSRPGRLVVRPGLFLREGRATLDEGGGRRSSRFYGALRLLGLAATAFLSFSHGPFSSFF